MIAEQYSIACEMVHMSDPLMYASFAVFSGEKHIPFDASSEDDKTLYVAYGRVLYISAVFWVTLFLRFLGNDRHPLTTELSKEIDNYVRKTLTFEWKVDSDNLMQKIWPAPLKL